MHKIYKKTMLTLIGCTVLVMTNLIGQNLLLNPGFESGILAPWIIGNENTAEITDDAHEAILLPKGIWSRLFL